MPLIAYLDETGDHTLEPVDTGFPVFALVLLVCDSAVYAQQIVPAIYQLKMDYFGHEAVILHSRDIRKSQGDFGFLTEPTKRQGFYDRINEIMSSHDYTLIASVIRKDRLKVKYGTDARNPYDLALTFSLERLLPMLESAGQPEIRLIAESRGRREDNELMLTFLQVVNSGTYYIPSVRFKQIDFQLHFKPKTMNIVGTQVADLAAYPIARHVLDPVKSHPSFSIVESKLDVGPGLVRGLKVFP